MSVDSQVRVLCVCVCLCLGVCSVYCLRCVLCFHDFTKAVLVTSSTRMPNGAWHHSLSMMCWWWAAPGWCCLAAPSVVQILIHFSCSSYIRSSVLLPWNEEVVRVCYLSTIHLMHSPFCVATSSACYIAWILFWNRALVICKIGFVFALQIKRYLIIGKWKFIFFHCCNERWHLLISLRILNDIQWSDLCWWWILVRSCLFGRRLERNWLF